MEKEFPLIIFLHLHELFHNKATGVIKKIKKNRVTFREEFTDFKLAKKMKKIVKNLLDNYLLPAIECQLLKGRRDSRFYKYIFKTKKPRIAYK